MITARVGLTTRLAVRFVLLAVGLAALQLTFSASAYADPGPGDWARLRQCESGGRYDINTGNGYYGAYQFDLPTWASVGGTGRPDLASPAEQDRRALALYRQRGWQPWECAAKLGLGKGGGSGQAAPKPQPKPQQAPAPKPAAPAPAPKAPAPVAKPAEPKPPAPKPTPKVEKTSDPESQPEPGSGGKETAAATKPAWPGGTVGRGQWSVPLKQFKLRMNTQGYDFIGNGYFGDVTERAVLDLQKANGLPETGKLDEATWRAAWEGKPVPSSVPKAKRWPGVVYAPGDSAPALKPLQERLNALGYQLKVDGSYDEATKQAVTDLQRANNIKDSGRLGPESWASAWIGKSPR